MEITQRYKLDDFVKKHADALHPLNKWIEHVEKPNGRITMN